MKIRASDFPFTEILENNWEAIRQEYYEIHDQLEDWVEKDLYEQGWKVFKIFDFPHGGPLTQGVKQCPVTAKIVESHIPTHGAVGFSILAPGTVIKPHVGYSGEFLRCHLGLEIPQGDCALQVEEEIYRWNEGKAFIFDDRVIHSAWNKTDRNRVALLVDFIP